jgi:hypothetical protein
MAIHVAASENPEVPCFGGLTVVSASRGTMTTTELFFVLHLKHINTEI